MIAFPGNSNNKVYSVEKSQKSIFSKKHGPIVYIMHNSGQYLTVLESSYKWSKSISHSLKGQPRGHRGNDHFKRGQNLLFNMMSKLATLDCQSWSSLPNLVHAFI